jgi:YggT family protein
MEVILVLVTALRIYEMLIFIRILLSWVPMIPDHKVIDWLIKVTDPVLLPAREIYMRIMDKFNVSLPIDLSPILVFLLIGFMERTLVSLY